MDDKALASRLREINRRYIRKPECKAALDEAATSLERHADHEHHVMADDGCPHHHD